MTRIDLLAVGLMAPGLPGWRASIPILAGHTPCQTGLLPSLGTGALPAGERRRATLLSKLAMAAAEDAMASVALNGKRPVSVFASSGGDLDIVDRICRALNERDRPVSPTHFHNSVHNAPAGYWAIGTKSRRPSLSLSAFDWSFAAGLMEAVSTVVTENSAVLLVAYDMPAPPPFAGKRQVLLPFAVALLLAPQGFHPGSLMLTIATGKERGKDAMEDPLLERLRLVNPAARSLPLLQKLARREDGIVTLPFVAGNALRVRISS